MRTVAVLPGGPFSGNRRKEIENLLARLEILEDTVVLPGMEEVEYGRFVAGSSVLVGSKVGGSRMAYVSGYSSGWLFTTSRKFFPEEKTLSGELELKPSPYRVEVDTPGSGLLELPGYRLGNGILILYAKPGYEFVLPRDTLTVERGEEYVRLSLRPLENGLEGKVRGYLKKPLYTAVVLRGKAVGDILFYQDKPGEFRYRFIEEPLLIVSHEKDLSPQAFQRAMNGFIGLSGHGEFTLRLEVGKAREEMRFTVEPSESGIKAR